MSQTTEKTMRCPFDPSHVMPYDRFLNHLDKCKFPGKQNYVKCRFNPYHVHHKDSIESHQNKCPDRVKYNPIQDDKDDWWGVEEEEEKPQKSIVSTCVTAQTTPRTPKEERPKLQSHKQKQNTKCNVVFEDFMQADFS